MKGETKTLVGVEVKNANEGIALVKFAQYDEIDHHNDVTIKGAFQEGKQVLVSSYNHSSWGGTLPVGKGTIRTSVDNKAAVAELQFFMNTQAGRETFETVKAAGDLQQWSYGFNVQDEETGEYEGKSVRFLKGVDVYEISPVLLGAGKSTATLAIKSQEGIVEELYDMDEVAEWLKAKPKPKPKDDDKKPKDDEKKPGDKKPKDDDEGKKPSDSKKPSDKEDDDEDDEDDDKKKPNRRKPKDSGKMRMSDHCIEVLTSVTELTDRAEEIVALRKADGKKGLAPETQVLLDLVSDQLSRLKSVAATSNVDETLLSRVLKNLSEEL